MVSIRRTNHNTGHRYTASAASGNSNKPFALCVLTRDRKTQIALAYVYWLQDTSPEVSVFWVHASTAARFGQAFDSIAQESHVPGCDDPKADVLPLVKAWLEKTERGRWLMVIDNADDRQLFCDQPERLGRYIPECAHGAVLITTRDKQVGSRLTKGMPPIEVRQMDGGDSVQLLRRTVEANDTVCDDDDLSTLSSRLEYLPLALAQAAAFMQENSMSVGDYLQLLDNRDQNLVELLSEEFETTGRDSETPRAVAETWVLSFEQIQRQNTLAGELLSVMSFFDRQDIPEKFLSYHDSEQTEGGLKEIHFQKALGLLKGFSFVTAGKDRNLNMHRLVQLVMRKWLANNEVTGNFSKQALLAVAHYFPSGDYENWTACSRYLPHVYAVLQQDRSTKSKDEEVDKARLLHRAGGYLDRQGHWKESVRLHREAVEINRRVFGPSHGGRLRSINNLALALSHQDQWEEAERLFVEVVEAYKIKFGVDHPDTLTSMDNLAAVYDKQARLDEAEKLHVEVIKGRKIKLGGRHPDTLVSMNNLASTYWKQNRLDEAEKLELKLFEAWKTSCGADHPNTLQSMKNLSVTYYQQKKFDEAERLNVEALELRKTKLGLDHLDTLTSMSDLATIYWRQNRLDEAEKLHAEVLETRKTKLGVDHIHTLESMNNLAVMWKHQGRDADALNLMESCVQARRRVLGETHPVTQRSLAWLNSWT
jgi:tetratricopeptide (TPR) repeat protein